MCIYCYIYLFQFQVCPKSLCVSTPGHRTDLFQRDPKNVLITDFFGSVRKVEITTETIRLQPDLGNMESRYSSWIIILLEYTGLTTHKSLCNMMFHSSKKWKLVFVNKLHISTHSSLYVGPIVFRLMSKSYQY